MNRMALPDAATLAKSMAVSRTDLAARPGRLTAWLPSIILNYRVRITTYPAPAEGLAVYCRLCLFVASLALVCLFVHGDRAAGPARPRRVKVAAVQCSSDLGAVAANRKKLTALVSEA